jgi:flagellar biosynthesis chaperone FliJ
MHHDTLVAADMQRRLKAEQTKVEELTDQLDKAMKEISDLMKQLKMLQNQRDKLLALQVAVVASANQVVNQQLVLTHIVGAGGSDETDFRL